MTQANLDLWHKSIKSGNADDLAALLADDVVFFSPIVHSPQRGKELTMKYLGSAATVLGGDSFRYVREVVGAQDAVLEFVAEIEGISVNGIDMIHWNEAGLITEIKVMIRPLKAINLMHQQMAASLAAKG